MAKSAEWMDFNEKQMTQRSTVLVDTVAYKIVIHYTFGIQIKVACPQWKFAPIKLHINKGSADSPYHHKTTVLHKHYKEWLHLAQTMFASPRHVSSSHGNLLHTAKQAFPSPSKKTLRILRKFSVGRRWSLGSSTHAISMRQIHWAKE